MSLCSFILSRGKNKGKECGKKCKEKFCSVHLKKKEKMEDDKNEDVKTGSNHMVMSDKNKGKLCCKKIIMILNFAHCIKQIRKKQMNSV
jgi:Fe-S-cluster containining protein